MPLIMADTGKPLLIKKTGGKEDCRKFLESLGLVPGATISIISKISGNIIMMVRYLNHYARGRKLYSLLTAEPLMED